MAKSSPNASSIVSRVPRIDPTRDEARARKLGGKYRVIHGTVMVPRPVAAYTLPDGSIDESAERFENAIEGDVVMLTDEDAARMLDADVVEPIDAKPSRVGKVWTPPSPNVTNRNAPRGARA